LRVARSSASFSLGNTANLKLTAEIAELFVNTIRLCGRVSVAAGRCGI
jgi:hypothetical protein